MKENVPMERESRFWSISYFAFIISFIILVIIFTGRLIEKGSHDYNDITVNYYLALMFLILVFTLSLLLLYFKNVKRKKFIARLKNVVFYFLLILVSGLSWSLRGVWGHETGALVWGTLLFTVLMLEDEKDQYLFLIFFANIGFAIGANLPFANYPFTPRLIHFATWGMLGCFSASFGRYLFYGKRFKSKEDFRDFHLKFSLTGFFGMALGITLASALYINEGWTPSWLGGYVTGAFFGLFLGLFFHHESGKFKDEYKSPEFLKLFENQIIISDTKKKVGYLVMCVLLLGYIPVAGLLNVGNYYYNELGYTEFPFIQIILFSMSYLVIIIIFIFKKWDKLVDLKYKNIILLLIFMLTLWPSTFSAIIRHNTGSLPNFWTMIELYEFERSLFYVSIIVSALFILYLALNHHVKKNKEV